jgi:putative Mn2+ efflux pump MntP
MWTLTGWMLLLWCVLLYGPNSTEARQGTYLTEILALAGFSVAFWAIRPWLGAAMTAAQILWNVILFVWLTPVMTPPGMEIGPLNFFQALLCVLSAAGMGILLARFAFAEEARSKARGVAQ